MPRYLPLNQSTQNNRLANLLALRSTQPQNNRLANLLALRSTQPQNILTGKAALAPYGQALMGATARIADAIGQRNRQEDLTSTITDAIRAAQGTPAGPAGQAAAAGVLPTAGGLSNAPTPAVAGDVNKAMTILAGNNQTAPIALQQQLASALNPKPSFSTKTGAELGYGREDSVWSVNDLTGEAKQIFAGEAPEKPQKEKTHLVRDAQGNLRAVTAAQLNKMKGASLPERGDGSSGKPYRVRFNGDEYLWSAERYNKAREAAQFTGDKVELVDDGEPEKRTSWQKNVEAAARIRGTSEEEAAEWLRETGVKSDDQLLAEFAARIGASEFLDKDEVRQKVADMRRLLRDIRARADVAKKVVEQGAGEMPEAPRDPQARTAGTIYMTPRGPMRWTGTGWLPAN